MARLRLGPRIVAVVTVIALAGCAAAGTPPAPTPTPTTEPAATAPASGGTDAPAIVTAAPTTSTPGTAATGSPASAAAPTATPTEEQLRSAAATGLVAAYAAFDTEADVLLARYPGTTSLEALKTLCGSLNDAYERLWRALKAITFPADARALADKVTSYISIAQVDLQGCGKATSESQARQAWGVAVWNPGSYEDVARRAANDLRKALGLPAASARPFPWAPTIAPTVRPPTPAPSHVVSLAERQLRGSRQPILDALAQLGYRCGPEQTHPNDLPTVACTFDGATPDEGVLMFAAANDFRGIGAFSYERTRLAAFLVVMGSQEISDDLLRQIDSILRVSAMPNSLCPLPCQLTTSGPAYGKLEGKALVETDGLMIVVLQEFGF